KKVLVEETPTLDTYESRRRARMLVGGLGTAAVVLLLWAGYRTFLYDPTPNPIASDEAALAPAPEPHQSLDQEARFMLTRAQDLAKENRSDQAVAMLNRLVKVYKTTATASAAQAALDRFKKSLPLFPDHAIVEARAPEAKPEPKPAEPPTVVATA